MELTAFFQAKAQVHSLVFKTFKWSLRAVPNLSTPNPVEVDIFAMFLILYFRNIVPNSRTPHSPLCIFSKEFNVNFVCTFYLDYNLATFSSIDLNKNLLDIREKSIYSFLIIMHYASCIMFWLLCLLYTMIYFVQIVDFSLLVLSLNLWEICDLYLILFILHNT